MSDLFDHYWRSLAHFQAEGRSGLGYWKWVEDSISFERRCWEAFCLQCKSCRAVLHNLGPGRRRLRSWEHWDCVDTYITDDRFGKKAIVSRLLHDLRNHSACSLRHSASYGTFHFYTRRGKTVMLFLAAIFFQSSGSVTIIREGRNIWLRLSSAIRLLRTRHSAPTRPLTSTQWSTS